MISERETVDLSSGLCPDCGCNSFHPGPRGGASINVQCAKCGACFNYSGPLPAQRIERADGVYSTHAGTLDRASAALGFFTFLADMRAERDAAKQELELAFSMLWTAGVTQERARTVANGISVLVQRMQREINAERAEAARWREDSLRQAATIQRLGAAAEDRNEVDAARARAHLSDLAALEAERDAAGELARKLNGYAFHLHECAFLRDADPDSPTYGKCTCGLNELVAGLK